MAENSTIDIYTDRKGRTFRIGAEFLSLQAGDDILIRATVLEANICFPRWREQWPHVRVRIDLDGGVFIGDSDACMSLGIGAIESVCPKPWRIGDTVRVDTPAESLRGILLGIHKECGWVEVDGQEAPLNYRWKFITRA